jgi:hypothetical protein
LRACTRLACPGGTPFRKFDAMRGVGRRRCRARAEWARRVGRNGRTTEGFFTVDFQSPDPDTLWCWTWGETIIATNTKLWETFADRRPIRRENRSRDEV